MHELRRDARPAIITIVGDAERIDLDALAESYGAVRQVTVEQLFAY